MRIALDPDLLLRPAMLGDHVTQGAGGIGAGLIDPDADVADDRRVLCLPQVGRAGKQGHPPVASQPEALEEAEAEGVVTREVEHALLLEEQDTGETARLQRTDGCVAPPAEFGSCKVDRHGSP